ncbi:hypothetical protein [Tepidiforma sp.]|uniref:hypothetical protein n=1 Tax=Tepidiforma sp. TaxID=2682230 RepID=UPI002ADDA745|nr:hypothetical protein [Tepidiforma sp.]
MTFDHDAFERWLEHRLGPNHGRRAVVVRDDRILVSKVEPGLPARVIETVERLSELFDPVALREVAQPGPAPVVAWQSAVVRVLERALHEGEISPSEFDEVVAGIESVVALLDACCWTCDGSPDWVPGPAQREALDEAERSLVAGTARLFTRHYGIFDGRPVENHCPGSSVARRLFVAARHFIESAPARRAQLRPKMPDKPELPRSDE